MGLEAIPEINRFDPVELKRNEDDLEAGRISPLDYCGRMLVLIKRFEQRRREE